MSLEYETRQQNSALATLKQRAAPPTLTDQKPNVLYTMPVQTVERLEEVLQQTLALQKTIQASMAALATKETLGPLKTVHKWKPGKQNGSAVRVKYTVPVVFRLQ